MSFLIDRAVSTVEVIRTISTPPPQVALVPENQNPEAGDSPSTVIDTEPARIALSANESTSGSGSSDHGFLGSITNSASGLTDTVQGAAGAVGVAEAEIAPMTILLMGVDARPGEAIDVGVRPDALAVMHLDPDSGSCRLLSIPRDTRVDLPGYGLTKINHALAVGGIAYQQLVVESFLNITIDHYALIDFGGVVGLVDGVGGITVTVMEAFTAGGYTFVLGDQELDGDAALVYARYRGGADGDFGRIERQQQVLRAIIQAASGAEPLGLVREVLPRLDDHLRTDLTPLELATIGTDFRATCTADTLSTNWLTGTVATFVDPLFNAPLSYVVVDEAEIRRKVDDLLDIE